MKCTRTISSKNWCSRFWVIFCGPSPSAPECGSRHHQPHSASANQGSDRTARRSYRHSNSELACSPADRKCDDAEYAGDGKSKCYKRENRNEGRYCIRRCRVARDAIAPAQNLGATYENVRPVSRS